jgi:hypothetical protein
MSTDRRKVTSEDLKQEVLAKIKQYEDKDFPEASAIHELIMRANPSLCPRLWYGMPGYAATKDSAVLCFFRKDTLISFGVTESANIGQLSDGKSFATSAWYITNLDEEAEDMITRTVSKVTK